MKDMFNFELIEKIKYRGTGSRGCKKRQFWKYVRQEMELSLNVF